MSLFGDDDATPAKAEKPKKPAKVESDGSVGRVETVFVMDFEMKWAFPPKLSYGKDRKHFKDLIATWGEAEVIRLVHLFFATTDLKVTRSDYSVGAFYSLAQHLKLISQRGGNGRTENNLDAAARATGKKGLCEGC